MEIWKTIPKYKNYQVSSLGRVKSTQKWRGTSERILIPCSKRGGYLGLNFCKDGKQKNFSVHKLVQIAFDLGVGVCDHIDGNNQNNHLYNLRVGTQRDNMQNMKCHRKGKLPGAGFDKDRAHLPNPWRAVIYSNHKRKYIGVFPTEQLAHEAYLKAVNKIK